MEIFDHEGVAVQTFGAFYEVWCYTGCRLIAVAEFSLLSDAIVFVDAIAEDQKEFHETYTIVELNWEERT